MTLFTTQGGYDTAYTSAEIDQEVERNRLTLLELAMTIVVLGAFYTAVGYGIFVTAYIQ